MIWNKLTGSIWVLPFVLLITVALAISIDVCYLTAYALHPTWFR